MPLRYSIFKAVYNHIINVFQISPSAELYTNRGVIHQVCIVYCTGPAG